MRIVEPFTIYQCTQCNRIHISKRDLAEYGQHVPYADHHGVVKRYEVNETLASAIWMISSLYSLCFLAVAVCQAIAHWPFGQGWKMPAFLWWSFLAACLISIVSTEGIITFGPSPWGKEGSWAIRAVRFLKTYYGSVASLVLCVLVVMLSEGIAAQQPLKAVLGFGGTQICLILMYYTPKTSCDQGLRVHHWPMFFLIFWTAVTCGFHREYPWKIAAKLALPIATALVLIPLIVIGLGKLIRYIPWLLVPIVRLWRAAERIVDEKHPGTRG